MKLLALGSVVPRSVGPHSIGSAEAGHRVGLSAGRSFCLSFHLALLGPTGAHWLDDPPDRSCKDSTQDYCLDVEHQPTDLAVGGSNPLAARIRSQVNRSTDRPCWLERALS
jgi:hypothetical protein